MEIEDELIELRFENKELKYQKNLFLDFLQNIKISLSDLKKREEENERFRFDEVIDYKECVHNLDETIKEFQRVNKIII